MDSQEKALQLLKLILDLEARGYRKEFCVKFVEENFLNLLKIIEESYNSLSK